MSLILCSTVSLVCAVEAFATQCSKALATTQARSPGEPLGHQRRALDVDGEPNRVVALTVRGVRTGPPQRVSLMQVECNGCDAVVAGAQRI
jgi:hypothetical protein